MQPEFRYSDNNSVKDLRWMWPLECGWYFLLVENWLNVTLSGYNYN